MSGDGFVEVARVAELSTDGVLGVAGPGGARICLVICRGLVTAFADECTHQAFPLSAGEVRSDGTIECTWHGARFDCTTGAVRQAPALEPLLPYPVRIEGDRVLVGPRDTDR